MIGPYFQAVVQLFNRRNISHGFLSLDSYDKALTIKTLQKGTQSQLAGGFVTSPSHVVGYES